MTTEPVPGAAGQGGSQPGVSPAVAALATPPPEPAPTPPAPAAPAGGEPAADPPAWWSGFENEELRGYAQLKGWKDAASAVESYRNLEKLKGVPAERLLTLPEDVSDQEAMKPIYEKIGMAPPEKPDGYGFQTLEHVDPEMAKAAEKFFHENGVPKRYAEAAAKFQVEYALQAAAKEQEQINQAAARDMEALQAEWGANYDALVLQAKRAASTFGFTEAELAHMEAFAGAANMYRRLAKAGEMIGESKFIEPGGNATSSSFLMTPESAKAQIVQLRSDRDFQARLLSRDPATRQPALDKWNKLHETAYPGGQ